MTEGTVMPNFNFTTEQAQALAMLMLSWRRHDVPARYVSGAPRTDPRNADELKAEAAMKNGPGGWFVQTGCFVCHSIAALGVKSPAQIGPDLSNAVEDVQSRFGLTIDAFLANPTGTMSVVLTRQIVLTPDQKQVAITKLRAAFAEYQRQKTMAQR
jgi:mono/diheme cytochrome c family protein